MKKVIPVLFIAVITISACIGSVPDTVHVLSKKEARLRAFLEQYQGPLSDAMVRSLAAQGVYQKDIINLGAYMSSVRYIQLWCKKRRYPFSGNGDTRSLFHCGRI